MLPPFKIRDRFSIIRMLVDGSITYHADGNVIYNDGQKPPTEKEISDKMDELQAEYDAQEYARKREAEYPTIQECVHAILDDDLTALQKKRKAVKTKYPKS